MGDNSDLEANDSDDFELVRLEDIDVEQEREGEENEIEDDLSEGSADYHSAQENEEEEDEEDKGPHSNVKNITFDITLPTAHSYLSEDWNEISGRTFHEEDEILEIPIMPLPGVVLMPGQLLPLHLFRNSDIAMIKFCLDGDKTFGQVDKLASIEGGYKLASVGTTAEIMAVKDDEGLVMKVKTLGRQRFKVINTRVDIGGNLFAKVKILPDQLLPHPFLSLFHLNHFKVFHRSLQTDKIKNIKNLKHLNTNLTQFPDWVYKQYDCDTLIDEIKKQLSTWNTSFNLDKIPPDPSSISYWLASTLPLDDVMKLELLMLDCTQQRLRCELSIMKKCTIMVCKYCQQSIARKTDVFSMSTDGPLATYVNPGGHVHETLTVYHAFGLDLEGRPCTDSSWFPGYAWTIARCKNCHVHLGWRFTLDKKSRPLNPQKFFGLCRASLVPSLQNEPDLPFLPIL